MNRNTRKSSSSAAAAAGNSQNSNNNNAVVVNKQQQQDERRFADESVSALAMPQVGSVSVKNVTSKSGFTQRAHHVCKNVTFEVRVASASSSQSASLDLTQCVVACQLVYDGRTAPLKLVDLPNATPMRYTALVEPHCVTLSVKIGVLSSQVDGELFRLKITATETNNSNTVHVAYSAPIAIVSKPYLALRAEGDRSKPKPLSHRQQQQQHVSSSQSSSSSSAAGATTTTTKSNRTATTTTSAASSFRPSSATSAPNDLLAIVMSEQAAQRRLLEQLLAQRNPQQQQQQHQLTSEDDEHEEDDSAAATTTTPSEERASKRRRDETDDGDDEDDKDNDDDEEYVPTSSSTASTTAQLRQSKRRRVVARKSLSKLRQQRDESSIDEDDNDDDNNEPAIELITNNDNNNDEDDDASSMSATTMPTPTTTASETATMSTQKQFVAALEAFVGAFDELTASGDVASRNATLSALLPTRVVEAIRASNGGNGDAACALFADGRCPHRRELERLDAMYELSLNINNSVNNTKKLDSNHVDLSYQNNNNAVVKTESFGFKSSIDDDFFLDADSSAIDNLVLNF